MILWKLEKKTCPLIALSWHFHKGSASFMIPFLSLSPFFCHNSLYKRTCNKDLCLDYFSFHIFFFS